jgi:hypothetical protein
MLVNHSKKLFNILIKETCQMKEGKIVEVGIIYLFFIFFLLNGTCHQYDAMWSSKNCMLYIVYTLNVPNPLN